MDTLCGVNSIGQILSSAISAAFISKPLASSASSDHGVGIDQRDRSGRNQRHQHLFHRCRLYNSLASPYFFFSNSSRIAKSEHPVCCIMDCCSIFFIGLAIIDRIKACVMRDQTRKRPTNRSNLKYIEDAVGDAGHLLRRMIRPSSNGP